VPDYPRDPPSGNTTANKTDAAAATEGAWKPPTDFARQTTKYWVQPADLLRLSVEIARHLPILIMSRQREPAERASAMDSPISSLYIDTASFEQHAA